MTIIDKKQGRKLLGVSIFGPHETGLLASKWGVTDILFAMPSMSKLTQNAWVEKLLEYNVRVRSIPTMSELLSNYRDFAGFVPLDPAEFLPHYFMHTKSKLLELHSQTVLVTRAGGSIGYQICCMIVEQKTTTLNLVEHSEFNFYKIQAQLEALLRHKKFTIGLFAILADVRDEWSLQGIFKPFKP